MVMVVFSTILLCLSIHKLAIDVKHHHVKGKIGLSDKSICLFLNNTVRDIISKI